MGMREVAGWPGYFVTSTGAVWSKASGRLKRLKPESDDEGYQYVGLTYGGRRKDVAVHRIVAEAWVTRWHPSCEVHHVDGDPSNNSAANLRCLTPAEHALAHRIWQDPEKVRRERARMDELIASHKPPIKGEPQIRGMLRAIESTRMGLERRGISL